MHIITILYWVTWAFLIFMLIRMVFDYVKVFARTWEPGGIIGVVHTVAYGVTNPPIKMTRKPFPPLRLGKRFSLDIAFLLVILLCSMVLGILNLARASFAI